MHGFSKGDARQTVSHFGMRKNFCRVSAKDLKVKDYHKPKPCPVKGCIAVPKRLGRHLLNFHKMPKYEQLTKFGSQFPAKAPHSSQDFESSSDEWSDKWSPDEEDNTALILIPSKSLMANRPGIFRTF